jgi:hypothetical protein
MKKILVPVDFSKHSEHAMEVAASIAKKAKCRNCGFAYDGAFRCGCNPQSIKGSF